MRNLPDLTQLSHEQKDELIQILWPLQQQVQDHVVQIAMMLAPRVNWLRNRTRLTQCLCRARRLVVLEDIPAQVFVFAEFSQT